MALSDLNSAIKDDSDPKLDSIIDTPPGDDPSEVDPTSFEAHMADLMAEHSNLTNGSNISGGGASAGDFLTPGERTSGHSFLTGEALSKGERISGQAIGSGPVTYPGQNLYASHADALAGNASQLAKNNASTPIFAGNLDPNAATNPLNNRTRDLERGLDDLEQRSSGRPDPRMNAIRPTSGNSVVTPLKPLTNPGAPILQPVNQPAQGAFTFNLQPEKNYSALGR